jgi:hypothetical protein
MPATVPTAAEFAALDARVVALESAEPPVVITPEPPIEPPIDPNPIPPDTTGVTAKRIHSLPELLGVNTFSSLDEHNIWGSWPADYRPAEVIASLNWMTNGSGFTFRLREYHYKGREQMQAQWLRQIRQAIPNTQTTICVCTGEVDVASMLGLQRDTALGVKWVEGTNEPNTDFGWGTKPPGDTRKTQEVIFAGAAGGTSMGSSVVAGMPHPEGWITSYFGSHLTPHNSAITYANGHYYPPGCPDITGDGTSINEYVGGLWSAYAQHLVALTEFHPSLFHHSTQAASVGASPDPATAKRQIMQRILYRAGLVPDDAPEPVARAMTDLDPYYLLMSLLRCRKCGVVGLWWYALFDYGTTYECGLFPKNRNNPRSSAAALRRLCTLTGDHGANLRTFEPHKLAVTVTVPDKMADWDVYEASDGRFFIPLWRAAQAPGGTEASITLDFGTAPAKVTEHDLLSDRAPIQVVTGQKRVVSRMGNTCRLLVVER